MGRWQMEAEIPSRLCGRAFTGADLERIREEIVAADPPQRSEIARRVCRALEWTDARGRPKLMSTRVGLLRLHRAGLIELPAASRGNGNGRGLVRGPEVWPEARAVVGTVGPLSALRLEAVSDPRASRLWNGLIARYHYLGYSPLPGAQLRYLIACEQGVLGAIGFGAAAWKVAARDRWIGWQPRVREAHLGRVLNNARFLLLPWVQVKNLASKVLSLAAARVVEDFPERYGEPVVLLETFVEVPRHQGTCYRAANWHYRGETAGRGKCDRAHRAALPRKAVYAYPLAADFRAALGVAA
jgi:Druantia protein DruA